MKSEGRKENKRSTTSDDALRIRKTNVMKNETKKTFKIKITVKRGTIRYTGNGKDWLVADVEKAQVYKTLKGAERWVEKFAKNQGKTQIITIK